MSLPSSLIAAFERLSHQDDDNFEMMECALLASRILQPSAKIDQYRPILAKITDALRAEYEEHIQNNPSLVAKVRSLQKVLCLDYGFSGEEDAFDDLEHLNIFSLLEHKYGTSLTLTILFVHCAKQCGWSVHALNFPGYYLIRIDEGQGRVILDPFNKCSELDAHNLREMLKILAGADAELKPSYSEPLALKSLALRHLNTMKLHFLRCQQMPQTLEILQALSALEPRSAAFWRETGLLQARLNQTDEAIASLKTAIDLTTDLEAIRHTQYILNGLINKFHD